MAIEDFLSSAQHGAYADHGVAGPEDEKFEGPSAAPAGGKGPSSGPIGTQAQVS